MFDWFHAGVAIDLSSSASHSPLETTGVSWSGTRFTTKPDNFDESGLLARFYTNIVTVYFT